MDKFLDELLVAQSPQMLAFKSGLLLAGKNNMDTLTDIHVLVPVTCCAVLFCHPSRMRGSVRTEKFLLRSR